MRRSRSTEGAAAGRGNRNLIEAGEKVERGIGTESGSPAAGIIARSYAAVPSKAPPAVFARTGNDHVGPRMFLCVRGAESGVDSSQHTGTSESAPAAGGSFRAPRIPVGHHRRHEDKVGPADLSQVFAEEARCNAVALVIAGHMGKEGGFSIRS